ncbi:MAG: tRNA1(Val) (adenine(37)-N6)-methyltransferase [Candidatus Muiribacteriota bacterium]
MKNSFEVENFYKKKFNFKQVNDYKLTLDSLILGRYPDLTKVKRVADFGCGSGVLEFLLIARKPGLKIEAFEIQKKLFETAEENFIKNNLKNVKVYNEDYTKMKKTESNKFDLIISNPPYMRLKDGQPPADKSKFRAKFEVDMTFAELVKTVNKNIKNKGSFIFSHIPSRIGEIFKILMYNKFGVKSIRFVHSDLKARAHIFICEAVKNINIETRIKEPLIILDKNKKYNAEIMEMFSL